MDEDVPLLLCPELLPAPDAERLAGAAAAADRAGALQPTQHGLLVERGWLRALAPAAVGEIGRAHV